MEPVTIAKIGLSALSFLGSRKDARDNRDAGTLDLARLRADATANGFNPVTVLNATGGQGFARPGAQPGFLSHVGAFGGQLVSDLYETSRQRKNDEISNSLLSAQTDSLRMQTALAPLQLRQMMQGGRSSSAPASVPDAFKSFDDWGFIEMWTTAGDPISVHGGIADALGLTPGGIWLAEYDEAVAGDLGSVPAQIGGIGDNMWQTMRGWFGDETANPYIKRGHTSDAGAVAPRVSDVPPPPLTPPPAVVRPHTRRPIRKQ